MTALLAASLTDALERVDGHFTKPVMVTEIPGPKSQELMKEMGEIMVCVR